VEVSSGVPSQPLGNDTIVGAINRAKGALGSSDYGVGIEAGLFWNELAGRHFDVQWCAIVDRRGAITLGHGPGFYYPRGIIAGVEAGRTVGEALEGLTGIEEIGRKEGAVGYLTEGIMDRRRLTQMAVLMALVPRIRRDLYWETP
jgi:inosine/xanthosine triphosphatase